MGGLSWVCVGFAGLAERGMEGLMSSDSVEL